MASDRTETGSPAGSSASASPSLRLPAIDSRDSSAYAHDGLHRAHRANSLAAAHAARFNTHGVCRASPVRLRVVRSVTGGTASPNGSSSGSHSNSPTAPASRIPLPRSTSAPDKLRETSSDDAVQMAARPAPPLPSPKRLDLDHLARREQHGQTDLWEGSNTSPSACSHAQGPSPRPPKRHPLRPVLHAPGVPTTLPSSDVPLLTPASIEDGSTTPSSAIFTSAFSSPLDSASAPRSFLQQQQQQPPQAPPSRLQSVSESPPRILPQQTCVANTHGREAQLLGHNHGRSDVSEQSIRSAKARERQNTGEEEILASNESVNHDDPASPELAMYSPGILSSQSFGIHTSAITTAAIPGAKAPATDGILHRSSSLSSSTSSMTSSLTGSESLSSHDRSFQQFHSRQRRTEHVVEETKGEPSKGHSESFSDPRNTTTTPKQARKVSSSSDIRHHVTTDTPRAPPSQQSLARSISNTSAALHSATNTAADVMPSQASKQPSSVPKSRDGSFGTNVLKELDRGSVSESPSSIQRLLPTWVREGDSSTSSFVGLGESPQEEIAGDLSFSGLPSLGGAVLKSSPKSIIERESHINGADSVKTMQQISSSNLVPPTESSTASGTESPSGSKGTGSSSAKLPPPVDKAKSSLSRLQASRPEVLRYSSSSPSAHLSRTREVKIPIVPGLDLDALDNTDGTKESKKSWKKAGQDYPKWNISQPLWYKAPEWGRLPHRGMRAHSATVVPNLPFSSSLGTNAPHIRPVEKEIFAVDSTTGSNPSSLYVFGGCDSKHCFKDLYTLDLQSFQWSKPRTLGNQYSPPPLRAHSVTYVPPFISLRSSIYDNLELKDRFPDDPDIVNVRMKSREGHLLFFGGGDGPNYFNDIYLLNLTTMAWNKPLPASHDKVSSNDNATSPQDGLEAHVEMLSNTQNVYGGLPSPRRAHTTVWFDKRKELVVFGGGNGSKALNEVWVLECKDWKKLTWKKIDAAGKRPRVRGYHTMNLLGSKAIIFGGSDGSECFSDVFVLDLDTFTWTEIPIYEPSLHCPRLSHSSTLISPTQLLILGGHNGTDYKKDITTFSLATGKFYNVTNATALSCYSSMGPSRRGYHTACLNDGRIIMVGGYDGKKHYNDVWCLEVFPVVAFGE